MEEPSVGGSRSVAMWLWVLAALWLAARGFEYCEEPEPQDLTEFLADHYGYDSTGTIQYSLVVMNVVSLFMIRTLQMSLFTLGPKRLRGSSRRGLTCPGTCTRPCGDWIRSVIQIFTLGVPIPQFKRRMDYRIGPPSATWYLFCLSAASQRTRPI